MRPQSLRGLTVGVALLVATPLVHAQRLSQLATGTVVSITTRNNAVFMGPIVEARGDTVKLGEYGNYLPNEVPVGEIVSYKYSTGRDRARGFRNGAMFGGGIGLALLTVTAAQEARSKSETMLPASALAGALTIVLAVAGGAIGSVDGPEQWVNPLPDRSAAPSWHVEPHHLRVSLRF